MTEPATDAQLLEQLAALNSRFGESYNPDTPHHIDEMVSTVELLAGRDLLKADVLETMALAVASVEYMLGATNRHQRVESYKQWRDALAKDPNPLLKWRAAMQTHRQDMIGRVAMYYPGRAQRSQ